MKTTSLVFVLAALSCNPSIPDKASSPAKAPEASPTRSSRSVDATNWHVTTDTSQLDNAIKTHVVHEEGEYTLVIRLLNGRITDFYVGTPTAVTDREGSVQVRFKLDKGAIEKQAWQSAEDYRGIFAPDPYFFVVKQLQQSSTLIFEYKPWLTEPKEVFFNTAGLPSLLSPLLDSTDVAHNEERLRRAERDRVESARRYAERARQDSLTTLRVRLARQRHVDSLKALITEFGLDPCRVWGKEDQAAVGAKCP